MTTPDAECYWRLRSAIETLLVGNGPLKEKLEAAMISVMPLMNPEASGEAELRIKSAIPLCTWKTHHLPSPSSLHLSLACNSWQTNKKIARLLWEAFNIAAEARFREIQGLSQD